MPHPISNIPVKFRQLIGIAHYTKEDVLDFCKKMQQSYPEAVYFDARSFRVWNKGEPALFHRNQPIELFCDAADLIEALPAYGRWRHDQTIRFVLRAPWPEELTLGQPEDLGGSRRQPYDQRNHAEWRATGRYLRVRLCINFPEIISGADFWRDGMAASMPNPAAFGSAKVLRRNCTYSEIEALYEASDPEAAEFARTARRNWNSLASSQLAEYEVLTGKFIGLCEPKYRYTASKRVLQILSSREDHYENLRPGTIDGKPAIVGIGPSPLFKEKVYKELGLPTDRIPGLAEVKAERAMKRRRKTQAPR